MRVNFFTIRGSHFCYSGCALGCDAFIAQVKSLAKRMRAQYVKELGLVRVARQ